MIDRIIWDKLDRVLFAVNSLPALCYLEFRSHTFEKKIMLCPPFVLSFAQGVASILNPTHLNSVVLNVYLKCSSFFLQEFLPAFANSPPSKIAIGSALII